jgi:hypothetical protein
MSGFITPVVALAAIVAALLAEQLGELARRITAAAPAAQEPQSERGSEWRRRCDLAENVEAGGGAARRRLHLRATAVVVVGADCPAVLPLPPDLDEEGDENGRATPACRAVPVRPVAGAVYMDKRRRRRRRQRQLALGGCRGRDAEYGGSSVERRRQLLALGG